MIEVDALFDRAIEATGLVDFGDDTLPERVGLVVDECNRSGLDTEGEAAAAATIDDLLTSRLQFFEDRKRDPLGDEVIAGPMFVTGEPRFWGEDRRLSGEACPRP